VNGAEGNSMCTASGLVHCSPGVEEQGKRILGFTQEPGRPCRLRRKVPVGEPGDQNPGLRARGAPPPVGAK
jgi:hypothetical protein